MVYSVEDSKSFQTALDRLAEIRDDEGREVAVILVANKSDLVRTRVIFEEGMWRVDWRGMRRFTRDREGRKVTISAAPSILITTICPTSVHKVPISAG